MTQLFGKLAVEKGFISEPELQSIVEQYGRDQQSGDTRRFGEIAVSLGLMSDQQVEHVVHLQKTLAEVEARTVGGLPQRRVAGAAAGGPAIHAMIESAIRAGASDLHIHAGKVPFIRRAAVLTRAPGQPVNSRQIGHELKDLLDETELRELDREGEVDACIAFHSGFRLRLNLFYERHGLCASIRIIPPAIPTLDELGLPSEVAGLTTFPQGLVLLVGPSGCGKTTTLAALVKLINTERKQHIVCIEDPIEFVYESELCTITQRQIHLHTADAQTALRAALREDPDVIVISELRDSGSVALALTAAETGHLVLATLHTTGCEGTITRMLDAFSGDKEAQARVMLAESLRGVLAQNLVPSTGGGLVPVVELLFNNRGIATCIRDRKLYQLHSLMQTGRSQNMISRERSVAGLYKRGLVSQAIHDEWMRREMVTHPDE